MPWKERLERFAARQPAKLSLHPGAGPEDFGEFRRIFRRTVDSVDPAWKEVLERANGLRVLSYLLYPISGTSIRTVAFKTNFLWEINPVWKGRVFLFAGGQHLTEIGILLDYLGSPCVAAIESHEAREAVPLSSGVGIFLDTLLEQAEEAIEAGTARQGWVPALDRWPPRLDAWYSADRALCSRLLEADPAQMHEAGPRYAETILNTCRALAD